MFSSYYRNSAQENYCVIEWKLMKVDESRPEWGLDLSYIFSLFCGGMQAAVQLRGI